MQKKYNNKEFVQVSIISTYMLRHARMGDVVVDGNNIKTDHVEAGCEAVDCIHLAPHGLQQRPQI
jgi:hypothetical protein